MISTVIVPAAFEGLMPIPTSAILIYCREMEIVGEEKCMVLSLVRKMDYEFLKIKNKRKGGKFGKGTEQTPERLRGWVNKVNDKVIENTFKEVVEIFDDFVRVTPVKTGFMRTQWRIGGTASRRGVTAKIYNDTFYFYTVYHGSVKNHNFPDPVANSIHNRITRAVQSTRISTTAGFADAPGSGPASYRRWINYLKSAEGRSR